MASPGRKLQAIDTYVAGFKSHIQEKRK